MKKINCLLLIILLGAPFFQSRSINAEELTKTNIQAETPQSVNKKSIDTCDVPKKVVQKTEDSNSLDSKNIPTIEQKTSTVSKTDDSKGKTKTSDRLSNAQSRLSEVSTDYDWDAVSGTLTVNKGEFQKDYPGVPTDNVNMIVINKGVTFPDRSNDLFHSYYNVVQIVGAENVDTTNVTDMSGMFSGASRLTNVDVSKWNTMNVKDMCAMFSEARSLTNVDVSKWNTANVTKMSAMFDEARSLTNVDVSKWNTANVTNMESMFSGASRLTNVDVSKWDTANVTNMEFMFSGTRSLTNVDVSKWNTANVTNMRNMFDVASSLTHLDVSKWDTANVRDMSTMFYLASSLTHLDVSKWNTANVKDMEFMFTRASSLTNLDVSKWNTANVTNMRNMFVRAGSLTNVDVSKWNTANVTEMEAMFAEASSLASLDLGKWNTANVKDMGEMFYEARSLTNVDVSKWNTANVKDMSAMFSGASSLASLDLGNWNTANVKDMSAMFKDTHNISTLVLGRNIKFRLGIELSSNNKLPPYTGKWLYIKNNSDQLMTQKSTFTDEDIEAYDGSNLGTYVWEKMFVPAKAVKVTYTDEKGKAIHKSNSISGNIGDAYDATTELYKLRIKGYTLDQTKLPQNSKGTLTAESQTVTYVYQANKPVPAKAVKVTYTDEKGKAIHKSNSISGNIGDAYDATTKVYKLKIKGYTLDQTKLPQNSKGTLTAESQTVTYVYQANKPVPAKIDSHHLKNNYSNETHYFPKTGEQVSNKLPLIGGFLIVLIAIVLLKTLKKEEF